MGNLLELQAAAHARGDASSRGGKHAGVEAQQSQSLEGEDFGGARNAPMQNAQDAQHAQHAQDVPAAPAGPAAHVAQHVVRRRCTNIVKVLLLILILELKLAWFGLFFLAAVPYVCGSFDPIVSWFHQRPLRTTLEQQLDVLRSRQRSAERASAEVVDVASDEISTPEVEEDTTMSTRPPVEDSAVAPEGAAGLSLNDVGDRGEPSSSSSSCNTENEISTSLGSRVAGEEETNAGNDAENGVPQPPWLHRFVYQLVVMFWMTLLPWWRPDPRYILA